MIEIVDYSEEYDEAIMALNPLFYFEIKFHADVIKDSICIALDDNMFAGAGFLMAGPSFLCVESHDLPYYHIHLEYQAVSGLESEIEATELLLDDLKDSFDLLQEDYPDKRLILRTWCKASSPLSLDFLLSNEFRPMRVTPIMKINLSELDYHLPDSNKEYSFNLTDDSSKSITIKPIDFDEDAWKSYLESNENAFKVPDSKAELSFKLNDPDTKVFGAFDGNAIIASVSSWKLSDDLATTENIFCHENYQGNGIASALIKYTFDYLIKQGYKEASLTVFGDNLPAISLYHKLGYEVSDELLEMHYEQAFIHSPY